MNLFLVTSPLQYICALEARDYFNCKNNILLLVNQKSKHGLAQQQKLLDKNDWEHIITIGRDNRSKQVPLAIKKIKTLLDSQPIERFFYAEYNAWRTKLLLKNLPVQQEVYFDDGTMTLLEFDKFILTEQPYSRPRLLVDLKVRLNGCKPIGTLTPSPNLEIFSMFALNQSKFTHYTNNLESLTRRYGNPKLYNPVAPIGIIGQGAIGDKNQPSIEQYVQSIVELANGTNKKILYFPHRTEKPAVKELIKRHPKIQYHYSEYPLELELIDKNISLSALIGAYSTAMFTCRKLYPDMPILARDVYHPDLAFLSELNAQMTKFHIHIVDNNVNLTTLLSELNSSQHCERGSQHRGL